MFFVIFAAFLALIGDLLLDVFFLIVVVVFVVVLTLFFKDLIFDKVGV